MRTWSWVAPVGLVGLLVSGCVTRPALVITDPPGAFILVDRVPVGKSPLEHRFRFMTKDTAEIAASLPGYYDTVVSVKENTPALLDGRIRIGLKEEEVLIATASSPATNQWLQLRINPVLDKTGLWQRLLEVVNRRYGKLEVQDDVTGYIRSVSAAKSYPTPTLGPVEVRTHFVGAITTGPGNEPSRYQVKLVSESRREGAGWREYDRVFREDAQMLDEIVVRMGIK